MRKHCIADQVFKPLKLSEPRKSRPNQVAWAARQVQANGSEMQMDPDPMDILQEWSDRGFIATLLVPERPPIQWKFPWKKQGPGIRCPCHKGTTWPPKLISLREFACYKFLTMGLLLCVHFYHFHLKLLTSKLTARKAPRTNSLCLLSRTLKGKTTHGANKSANWNQDQISSLHNSFEPGRDASAMCQQVRHFCKLLEDTFLC